MQPSSILVLRSERPSGQPRTDTVRLGIKVSKRPADAQHAVGVTEVVEEGDLWER